MNKKQFIKYVLFPVIWKEVDSVDTGYEMGCLISREFTPPPSYESVWYVFLSLMRKSEFTAEEIMHELRELSVREGSRTHYTPYTDMLSTLEHSQDDAAEAWAIDQIHKNR